MQGPGAFDVVSRIVVIDATPGEGIFVYSPTAGPGNLVASIDATFDTDQYGNAVIPIIASYSGNIVSALIGAALRFIGILNRSTSPPTVYSTQVTSTGTDINVSPGKATAISSPLTLSLYDNLGSPNGVSQAVLGRVNNSVAPSSTALLEVQGSINSVATAAAPSLITTDTWHSLGALGAGFTVVRGRYRLTTDNELELDISVNGNGTQATAETFANTLPAQYQPLTTHDFLAMGTNRLITAGDIPDHLTVTAGGLVTVNNDGTAHSYAICVRIPLD